MTPYSYHSIHLNGRNIEITDILNGQAIPTSDFEASVCHFIKNWLEGTEKFIQQTSGSTGAPKSISITRQQMVASAKLTEEVLKLAPSDVALVCLDPEYIAEK
jgi:o-succinylbenzoate---CoA ligase